MKKCKKSIAISSPIKKICSFLLILSMLLSLSLFTIPASADTPTLSVLGASIRTEGVQGLRFVGKVKKSAFSLTIGENANFGILLIPQSSVSAGTQITNTTSSVQIVPAKKLLSQASVESLSLTYDPAYYYFSAVLTGIPEESYGTEIIARAYVKNGGNYTYSSGQTLRSVLFIASEIIKDVGIPEEQKDYATSVLSAYERIGSDILIDGDNIFHGDHDLNYDTSVLQNTYHRLAAAKKLNVAYLGGSVTVGVGLETNYYAATDSWRALTTKWLKDTFPKATITETNAGIGGTGSAFGAYRARDDLKLTDSSTKPDLLFIDFAINDAYDAPATESAYASDVRTYMETIIRTVYEYAPYCDIILVYTTDKSRRAGTSSSDFPSLAAQHDVATKYGLTEIYVGKMLVEEAGLTASNWNNTYFGGTGAENPNDIVHPNSKGYKKYAGYVQNVLKAELVDKTLNPFVYSRHSVPSASYSPIAYPARYFFNDANGKTTGFELIEKANSLADKGYLRASTTGVTGAKVAFTFTGTGLQLWTYARSEASTIRVTIDGVSANYTIQRGSPNNKMYRVASGLSNTAHTVTIELIATSSNSGNLFTLQALMVEGDPNYTGVTFQSVD